MWDDMVGYGDTIIIRAAVIQIFAIHIVLLGGLTVGGRRQG